MAVIRREGEGGSTVKRISADEKSTLLSVLSSVQVTC